MAKTIQGFDTRLKEAMHLKGMKQVELSEKTGISCDKISCSYKKKQPKNE